MKLLKPLETEDVPVRERPEDERAAALGAAGARRADQVHRVDRRRQAAASGLPRAAGRQEADAMSAREEKRGRFGVRRSTCGRPARRTPNARTDEPPNAEPANAGRRTRNSTDLLDQLSALEDAQRDGVARAARRRQLKVTNLHKVFWPKQKLTKGDLFRYYARSRRASCRRSPIGRWS